MKKIFTKASLLALLASAVVSCGGSATPETVTLSAEGLSCLTQGAPLSSIPGQCEGLYDRVEQTTQEDMGDTYTLYTFYAGDQKVAEIPAYGETIDLLMVYAPNVVTPDGVYPGMKVSELLTKPGLVALTMDGFEYELNGYRFRVNGMNDSGAQKLSDSFAQGTEPVLGAEDFEPDATVESIYYVGN